MQFYTEESGHKTPCKEPDSYYVLVPLLLWLLVLIEALGRAMPSLSDEKKAWRKSCVATANIQQDALQTSFIFLSAKRAPNTLLSIAYRSILQDSRQENEKNNLSKLGFKMKIHSLLNGTPQWY